MTLTPPLSTLFPYTTLFRSRFSCARVATLSFSFLGVLELKKQFLCGAVAGRGLQRSQQMISRFLLLVVGEIGARHVELDRKSTRLNSSHPSISYAVFCLKKK